MTLYCDILILDNMLIWFAVLANRCYSAIILIQYKRDIYWSLKLIYTRLNNNVIYYILFIIQ